MHEPGLLQVFRFRFRTYLYMCLRPDFCLENQTPELDGMLSTDSFNEESAGGLGIMMFA